MTCYSHFILRGAILWKPCFGTYKFPKTFMKKTVFYNVKVTFN